MVISFLFLVLDQSVKYFFAAHPERVGIFGYYLNSNFAWSLSVSNQISLLLSLLLFVGLLVFYRFLFLSAKERVALSFIASGALSNIIDRIFRGGVVDYIHLYGGGVINLADIMILFGVILLIMRIKSN